MIDRRRLLLAACALPLGPAAAQQGFAGLGEAGDGFAAPDPKVALQFPADHGPHPRFRIEWWYLTANLTGSDGAAYGAQWTLFRNALAPRAGAGWSSPQLWMAHAALTSAATHRAAEKRARGGVGQAGVAAAPFHAHIDDWSLAGDSLAALTLRARGPDFAYALDLAANGPLVLQGDGGYSVKSPDGRASHYYSQPFYSARGTLTLDGAVTPVTGRAWLDREWSSAPLAADQQGWDWLALHLDDGRKLMAAQLRGARPFTLGTRIAPDGAATPLPDGALRLTPRDDARFPARWRIEAPGETLEIAALNPDSLNRLRIAYWEGPVRVVGGPGGVGYLEMTGR